MKHSMKYAAVLALTTLCLSCTTKTKQPNPLAKEILNNLNLQVVDSMGRSFLKASMQEADILRYGPEI
jgi:hypothetical protein